MTRLNVEVLLSHLGIVSKRNGRKRLALCPNPRHDDSNPSWAIIDSPEADNHGSHFCQSCKWGGGPWELAAAVWGCDVKEAGKRLSKLFRYGESHEVLKDIPHVKVSFGTPDSKTFSLPVGVVVPGRSGNWYGPALNYLESRGITRERADYLGAGFSTWGRLVNRVVFPVYDSGHKLLSFSARSIVKSEPKRYLVGREVDGAKPRRAIWGEVFWDSTETVTVAEGVFSALALMDAGFPNVSSLLGSELTEEKALVLNRFSRILVATDPDAAGEAVARHFESMSRRKRVIRLQLNKSPDETAICDLRDLLKRI